MRTRWLVPLLLALALTAPLAVAAPATTRRATVQLDAFPPCGTYEPYNTHPVVLHPRHRLTDTTHIHLDFCAQLVILKANGAHYRVTVENGFDDHTWVCDWPAHGDLSCDGHAHLGAATVTQELLDVDSFWDYAATELQWE